MADIYRKYDSKTNIVIGTSIMEEAEEIIDDAVKRVRLFTSIVIYKGVSM